MTEAATRTEERRTSPNPLTPEDELGVPKPRRLMHALTEEDGTLCLYLYYGVKEICFDDPRLIPFGRGLLDHPRFRAEEACRWSDGEPHDWGEVQELLEVLLEEEILVRAADLPDPAERPAKTVRTTRESDRSEDGSPRRRDTWSRHEDRCPYLTAEIFGHSQGSEHLEFLIPSFRVAHPAFDRDDRQVGEANVYPPELHARVPTEWRTCPYSGSRYQDERPMNVSALRAMSEHWDETLDHTLEARDRFLRRTGLSSEGDLRLGDLHLLSLFLLAIPGYMLQRPREPVPNGELSPAIASLFRVTDGVRFSAEHFIHGHGGEALPPDARLDPQAFFDLVEQECLFLGVHGVCSGPAPRVLEFLELMIRGRDDEREGRPGTEGTLEREVGSLDAAFDYTVLTTWLTATQELFWHRTATLAHALGEAVADLEAPPDCPRPDVLWALRETARHHERFQTEPPRLRRPEVLEETIRRCAGLAEGDPAGDLADASRLLPAGDPDPERDGTAAALHRFLRDRHVSSALPPGTPEALVPAVLRGAALERRALAVFNTLQRRVDELLERPPMSRPLGRRDLAAQGRVLAGAVGEEDTPDTASRVLVTDLAERLLGIEIELGEDSADPTVVRHGSARMTLRPGKHSPDTGD